MAKIAGVPHIFSVSFADLRILEYILGFGLLHIHRPLDGWQRWTWLGLVGLGSQPLSATTSHFQTIFDYFLFPIFPFSAFFDQL